jgi:hypothetical protein
MINFIGNLFSKVITTNKICNTVTKVCDTIVEIKLYATVWIVCIAIIVFMYLLYKIKKLQYGK